MIRIRILVAPTLAEVRACVSGVTNQLIIQGNQGGESADTLEIFTVLVGMIEQVAEDASGELWKFSGTLGDVPGKRSVKGSFNVKSRHGWLEIAE